jgi:hypothetical protein
MRHNFTNPRFLEGVHVACAAAPNCSRGGLTCVGCCLSLSHAHTSCNSTKILHSRRTVAQKKKMLDFWWESPLISI